MDDELKAQVADFYRRAIAEGATEEQAVRLARRFMAETTAAGGPTIGPAGPTAQPAFAKLPPMAGGALDFLIAFGTGATFGAANLIPGVGEMNAEIRERAPRTAILSGAGGAALSIPLTSGASAMMGLGARGAAGLAGAIARNRMAQILGGGALGGGIVSRLLSRGDQ